MNLPNKLTLLRFVLVPVFMVFMYIDNPYSYLIGLIVFAVASFTDFLDGKFMDPLADKLLTTVALIYLCLNGFCHEVVICIVLAREFAVSGIRLIAAANPKGSKVIAAGMMGKAKTVLQMVASMLGLLAMALFAMDVMGAEVYAWMSLVTNVLMWIMAVLTVVSGMQYIIPNFDLIKNAK